MRTTLISAISACAHERLQEKARTFLEGLSTDELQYIAGFLGSCALESAAAAAGSMARLAQLPCAPAGGLTDREHKVILLREYLRRCAPGEPDYCSSRTQMLR